MSNGRIVLVGHCGPDVFLLRNAVRRAAPDAEISAVNDERELRERLRDGDVLLVNRVLDGRFDAESGIDLIRSLSSRFPTLLVSNLEDAQREAVDAGALPGFGKSDLYDGSTRERIGRALDHDVPREPS